MSEESKATKAGTNTTGRERERDRSNKDAAEEEEDKKETDFPPVGGEKQRRKGEEDQDEEEDRASIGTVSYTHLTLPTILRV